MQAALIGPPSSGKSTLFAAATGHKPNPAEIGQSKHAVVSVPDRRLKFLEELYSPKKVTHATIEFVDFPGFSLTDPLGQQSMKKHLTDVRNADVLVIVVRGFDNPSVPAYRDRIDCAADLMEIRDELHFADLEVVTNRVERLEKSIHRPSKTKDRDKRELALLLSCREALEEGKPLSTAITTPEDRALLSSFAFLSEKPGIVVYNIGEDQMREYTAATPEHFHSAVGLCAEAEAQIQDLDPDDRLAFLEDLGITETARDRLVSNCYEAMNFISFLTMGPDEVRAWPIRKGTVAVDAAGKIHSDLARGFIRAETVAYNDLMENGDFKSAKAAGKVRQEGKSYEVQDGDILNIKFNV